MIKSLKKTFKNRSRKSDGTCMNKPSKNNSKMMNKWRKKHPKIDVETVSNFRSENVFKIDAKIVNGRFKAARGPARINWDCYLVVKNESKGRTRKIQKRSRINKGTTTLKIKMKSIRNADLDMTQTVEKIIMTQKSKKSPMIQPKGEQPMKMKRKIDKMGFSRIVMRFIKECLYGE